MRATRGTRARLLAGAAVAGTLVVGVPASHAVECSARVPAAFEVADRRGFDGDRLRATLGERRTTDGIVELKVSGCELPAREVPVRVHGLSGTPAVTARLVPKSPTQASLIVHLDEDALRPGEYDLTMSTGDPALPLVLGLDLDVKDGRPGRPVAAWLAACVVGTLTLALRAAAASNRKWRSLPAWFRGLGWLMPCGAGLAVAFTVLWSRYFESATWFATGTELVGLFVASLGAFVAGGTGATAVSSVAARSD